MIAIDLTIDKNEIYITSKHQRKLMFSSITDDLTNTLLYGICKNKKNIVFTFEPNLELKYIIHNWYNDFTVSNFKTYAIRDVNKLDALNQINKVVLNYERSIIVKPLCSNPFEFVFYLICWNKNKTEDIIIDDDVIITNNLDKIKRLIDIYISYCFYFENNSNQMLYYIGHFQEWLKNKNKIV